MENFHTAIVEVCYHYAIMDQQAKNCQFYFPHHFSGSKQLQSYEKKDKGCNFSLLRLYLLALLKKRQKVYRAPLKTV